MTERGMFWRIGAMLAGLALLLAGLVARLAVLHLGDHAAFVQRVDERRQFARRLVPGRGVICDCRGRQNILALNLAVEDVCADPALIVRSNRVAEATELLAGHLGVAPDEVAVKLNDPVRRFAYIQRFVRTDRTERIRAERAPGIVLQEGSIRFYPQRAFMCHVLGFVNHEGVGGAGIEQALDIFLRGSAGLVEGRLDARRSELYWERRRYIAPMNGAETVLTLDQNIQDIVERGLEQVMVEHRARGAWAIVQRVRTGEILALASRPGYDPNGFSTTPPEALLNRAIGQVYEPGSTMKAVVFAAAFNEGVVTPDDVFDCHRGHWRYGGHTLHDAHAYDRLTVADGLKKSSNILTAKLSLVLGKERLHAYLRAFGFGAALGLDLPGEERGLLAPAQEWEDVRLTRVAIGQGVAVTALQMLGAMSAIANDGFLMRPYVVKQVTAADGTVLRRGRPQVLGRPITAETAALMRRLLARVMEDGGTGRRARVPGYSVAGKTGSAQKAVGGRYSDVLYVASFVGFLPVDRPEVALIVVVDEPQPLHTGGVVAGPVFGRMAAETVRYLGVAPVRPSVAPDGEGPTSLAWRDDR